MPTVAVDTDDLEALLFATGGIRELEAALAGRKQNPMVRSGEAKLAGAHDRLSTAWRRAKREADWPKRVVTEAEIAELRAMFTGTNGAWLPFVVLDRYPMHFAQELLLVESGPLWQGLKIDWPSPAEPEFVVSHSGDLRYAARLSHYGRQVIGVSDSDIERARQIIERDPPKMIQNGGMGA
jgi:hypothetical protein